MSTNALTVESITKRFGAHVAVSAFSFRVPVGTIYGILGPNGAGKSTTLRMINNIIMPDEGKITILDSFAPGREAAKRIGYLPEERGLYPKMKVWEALSFFGQLRGLSRAVGKQRADEWLERLEISKWRNNRIRDLSKGMAQKVQFAASLIHEPELLILDEPWSGLDPINAEVLKRIVLEQSGKGRTVIFSTHLMEQAEQICDHVCIIAHGQKVLEGTMGDIRREAAPDGMMAIAFQDQESERRAVQTLFCDPKQVLSTQKESDEYHVQLAPGASAHSFFQALVTGEFKIRRVETIEPTLHEIFVSRVGAANAIAEAKEEGAA